MHARTNGLTNGRWELPDTPIARGVIVPPRPEAPAPAPAAVAVGVLGLLALPFIAWGNRRT